MEVTDLAVRALYDFALLMHFQFAAVCEIAGVLYSYDTGIFFFSSRRRHTRFKCDWSSDVCSSDLLDRNGLRPGRYWVTRDGLVVLASEVGVLDIDPAIVVRKGRLQPGRIFLADTVAGRIVEDEEVKAALAAERPYEAWLHAGLVHLDNLPDRALPEPAAIPHQRDHAAPAADDLIRSQRMHGYTEEELRVILAPMARSGAEPVGSMGTDTPLAVLSSRPRLVFDYFTQLFAQVTNPPLDAIREELVNALSTSTGPEHNLLTTVTAY